MSDNRYTREINIGRMTGMSSYELAVKHGYTGTEEEYVNKEQSVYNNVVQIRNQLNEKVTQIDSNSTKVNSRTNDLGDVTDKDTIYNTYSSNPKFHKSSSGKFSYTCTVSDGMITGVETATDGAQTYMSWTYGLMFRIKINGVWSSWSTLVCIANESEV